MGALKPRGDKFGIQKPESKKEGAKFGIQKLKKHESVHFGVQKLSAPEGEEARYLRKFSGY